MPEAASAQAARSGVAFTPFAAGSRAIPLAVAGAPRPTREESVPEAVRKGRVVLPTGVLSLEPGELLRIDSGFRPAPLVESIAKQGFRSFVREASPARFETFVARASPPGSSVEGRRPEMSMERTGRPAR